jgi:hypothetical protein
LNFAAVLVGIQENRAIGAISSASRIGLTIATEDTNLAILERQPHVAIVALV